MMWVVKISMTQTTFKTIKVSVDTHEQLKGLGEWGETMDSIIVKCIDAYAKLHKTTR